VFSAQSLIPETSNRPVDTNHCSGKQPRKQNDGNLERQVSCRVVASRCGNVGIEDQPREPRRPKYGKNQPDPEEATALQCAGGQKKSPAGEKPAKRGKSRAANSSAALARSRIRDVALFLDSAREMAPCVRVLPNLPTCVARPVGVVPRQKRMRLGHAQKQGAGLS
jgi:hypothetical protein